MTDLDVRVLMFVGPSEIATETEQKYTALAASVRELHIVGTIPASSKIHEQTDITVFNPPWFVPYFLYTLFFPLTYHQKCKLIDIARSTTRQDIISALIISSLWDCRSVVATTFPRTSSERNAIGHWIELAKWIPERFSHMLANAIVSESAEQYLDIEQQHWVRAEHFVLHPAVDIADPQSISSENKPVFVDAVTRDHSATIVPSVVEDSRLLLLTSDIQVTNIQDNNSVGYFEDRWWAKQELVKKFDLIILLGGQSIKTTLQAMAIGLPIITTEASESRELVDDGKDGIVTSRDSDSIRETIAELLMNASTRTVIGDAARKKSRQRYSIKQAVTRELAVYRAVLGQEHS